jgi:membrane-associated protein
VTPTVLGLVHDAMSSPWVYAVLFALSMVDAFLPAVPSESVVIAAGAFAAAGQPDLALVIVASALGAFTGDHVSFVIGRYAIPLVVSRTGRRRRSALDRAARLLDARGGTVIVAARYIPGARTAVTLTAGSVHYPRRRFTGFAALAAATWAVYSSLIGYIGGIAVEQNPVAGVVAGLALAGAITVGAEVTRSIHLRHRAAIGVDGARCDRVLDLPAPARLSRMTNPRSPSTHPTSRHSNCQRRLCAAPGPDGNQ